MRYELHAIVGRAARRYPDDPMTCAPFSGTIGVWREELCRVLEFLDDAAYLRYCGPGPEGCITTRGIDLLDGEGKRSKGIPDEN